MHSSQNLSFQNDCLSLLGLKTDEMEELESELQMRLNNIVDNLDEKNSSKSMPVLSVESSLTEVELNKKYMENSNSYMEEDEEVLIRENIGGIWDYL